MTRQHLSDLARLYESTNVEQARSPNAVLRLSRRLNPRSQMRMVFVESTVPNQEECREGL